MRRSSVSLTALFILAVSESVVFGGGTAPNQPIPRTGLSVWDTGRPAQTALPGAAFIWKKDWTYLPLAATTNAFKGDAVIINGGIALVLRKQDGAAEIHALKLHGAVSRFRLRLQNAAGEPAERLERMALIENAKGSVCLEATFKTAKGETLAGKFRIKRGDVSVQVEPGIGAKKLRMDCLSRFVVLPDFFADDITLDATRLPLASVELPSENFILHPTGNGDALALCVFENRQQDVKVTLAGEGNRRQVTGSEIGFEGKKIWVALLEAPQIWHLRELKPADTGKVIALDWKMPFPAQWRVDFTRTNDLTDSWEMLLSYKDPSYVGYIRHSWLGGEPEYLAGDRSRWNTVLGTYSYPAWTDSYGIGYLQPLKSKMLQFTGPALIYPIHRVKETPLTDFTIVDVMRNTLGVGPCEHILEVQAHKGEYKGQATCGVRDILNPIYALKQPKELRPRDLISKTLDDGLIFVRHIRGRINDYVAFGKKMRGYLAEQRKAHPELADFIDEMDQLTQQIDKRVAARADKINTPEYVVKLMEDFRKNVLDYDGLDAEDRCKTFTRALWVVGDNQDELSGECRWVVKTLRQRAGIRMALDARVAPIASEIRARTQEVMRNPAWHEAARH